MSECVTTICLGDALSLRTERAQEGDQLLSVTQDRGVIPQEEAGRRNIASADKSSYRRVCPGDLVYNTMRMWQGASALSEHFGIVSPAYTVCEPKEGFSSRYLAYLLKLPENVLKFRSRCQGITSDVWNLRFDEFSRIPTLIVEPDARRMRIAEILSTVDEAIKATEKLIAKHQQIKAGLMHDLFTRGLTPDGHLRPPHTETPDLYKDSPLGPIPKEWECLRLEEVLRDKPRNGYSPSEVSEWDGVYALGLGCLTTDGFRPRQLKFVLSDSVSVKDALLQDGDLLLSRSNTRSLVGLCGRYRDLGSPCIYPDLMMRLRPNGRMPSELLEAILLSSLMRRQITSRAVGTSGSMVKLNASSVQELAIAVPADCEHAQLVEGARAVKQELAHLESECAQLASLKRGLMHDLLTGKVEVPAPSGSEESA